MDQQTWHALAARRVSRRAALGAGGRAGLGASALALVGCGDDDEAAAPDAAAATADAQATSADEPAVPGPTGESIADARRGGVLRHFWRAAELNDPHFDAIAGLGIWRQIGDVFLEEAGAPGNLRGYLIETYEQIDPVTLRLNVRAGVRFHDKPPADGRLMEARDVVYTLQSLSGDLFPDELHPRAAAFARVAGIAATDAATVAVGFDAPSSFFIPAALGDDRNVVIPEGIREYFGGSHLHDARPERHIGTGPFIPDSYQPFITFRRNPDWWNAPYPFLDGVETHDVSDRSTQISGILGGQFHHITDLTQEELDLIGERDDVAIRRYPPPGYFSHIGFNTRRPHLADPRVRRALAGVMDRPRLGAAIVGNEADWRFPGPLPWTYADAIPQADLAARAGMRSPTDADIADARALMDAAGLGQGGLEVAIRTPDIRGVTGFPAVAEHLADRVDRLLPGNRIQINLQTYTEMLAGIQALDFDAYQGGWTHEADSVLMLIQTFQTDGPRAFTGYSSPEVDQMLEDALAEVGDPDRRAALVRQVQERALADVPVTGSHHVVRIDAERSNLRGLAWSTRNAGMAFFRYAWFAT